MANIFIDGEAGTTGLGIRDRLGALPVTLLQIDPELRKDPTARQALMADSDITILCLPDETALEAVSLADALGARAPRLLDASSAHRIAPGWVYGFPELSRSQHQSAAIKAARRVSNPGCYATGAIALLAPLCAAGLIPPNHPISINAISGYSGGGRQMIAAHESMGGPSFELYALGLAHKHVPEIMRHAGLTRRPVFVPSVGHFAQGMLVSIPLHSETLPSRPSPAALRDALAKHYAGTSVQVIDDTPQRLAAEMQQGTDDLELRVCASGDGKELVLVARLDNLGKGASGAAVQNLRLMLALQ